MSRAVCGVCFCPYGEEGDCACSTKTHYKKVIDNVQALFDAMREQPAQQQEPWVGLTDEEMNAALDYWSEDERSAYGGAHAADEEYVSMIDTWRYIEAKLKEKNT